MNKEKKEKYMNKFSVRWKSDLGSDTEGICKDIELFCEKNIVNTHSQISESLPRQN
jgi:hypothetical protein